MNLPLSSERTNAKHEPIFAATASGRADARCRGRRPVPGGCSPRLWAGQTGGRDARGEAAPEARWVPDRHAGGRGRAVVTHPVADPEARWVPDRRAGCFVPGQTHGARLRQRRGRNPLNLIDNTRLRRKLVGMCATRRRLTDRLAVGDGQHDGPPTRRSTTQRKPPTTSPQPKPHNTTDHRQDAAPPKENPQQPARSRCRPGEHDTLGPAWQRGRKKAWRPSRRRPLWCAAGRWRPARQKES